MRRIVIAAVTVLALAGCGGTNTPTNAQNGRSPNVEYEEYVVGESVTVWDFKLPDGTRCLSMPDAVTCDWGAQDNTGGSQ